MKIYIMANTPIDAPEFGFGFKAKHNIVIDGETLLQRMCRQLLERGQKPIISGTYHIDGCTNYHTTANTFEGHIIDLAKHTDKEGCIILYGDCYYTDQFIDFVIAYQPDKWCHFCRLDANPHTGKKYGEGYGFKITDNTEFVCMGAHFLLDAGNGIITPEKSKWSLNRYLNGEADIYSHHEDYKSEHDVIYNCDETDDFDYPSDIIRFCNLTGHKMGIAR